MYAKETLSYFCRTAEKDNLPHYKHSTDTQYLNLRLSGHVGTVLLYERRTKNKQTLL